MRGSWKEFPAGMTRKVLYRRWRALILLEASEEVSRPQSESGNNFQEAEKGSAIPWEAGEFSNCLSAQLLVGTTSVCQSVCQYLNPIDHIGQLPLRLSAFFALMVKSVIVVRALVKPLGQKV